MIDHLRALQEQDERLDALTSMLGVLEGSLATRQETIEELLPQAEDALQEYRQGETESGAWLGRCARTAPERSADSSRR